MARPTVYTESSARTLAEAVRNLYFAMDKVFGPDKAWEFVLTFYQGAGSND